jgi:hypothetical protein
LTSLIIKGRELSAVHLTPNLTQISGPNKLHQPHQATHLGPRAPDTLCDLHSRHQVRMVSRDASGALCPRSQELVPGGEEEDTVFESTACLQYLADRYSAEGVWSRKTAAEKAEVLSWTAYQTAGLG